MKPNSIVNFLAILGVLSRICELTVESCEVDFEYIHDGTATQAEECPTADGVDFGSYRFHCLGDLSSCSNGMTIKFWFKPAPIPFNGDEVFVMSNGGHLPYSEGFYVSRKWNDQYSVGMSKGDRTWKVDFRLLSDVWVHVMITWQEAPGLIVFIDGFVQEFDPSGASRYYTGATYDVSSHVVLGGWTTGRDANYGMTYEIKRVTITNTLQTKSEVQDEIGEDDKLYIGCEETTVLDATNSVTLTEGSTAVKQCRAHCKEKGYIVARLDASLRCNCSGLSARDTVNTLTDCTSPGQSKVYYVTHVTSDVDVSVDVSVTGTTGNPDINVFESVLITISTPASGNADDITVDLGDGNVMRAIRSELSYLWSTEGTYDVTVTAVFGQVQKVVTATVQIVQPVETVLPEYVRVFPSHQNESLKVSFEVLVVDKESTSCLLNIGEGAAIDLSFTKHIQVHLLGHTYPAPFGNYDITMECSNTAGSLQWSNKVTTQNFQIQSSLSKLGDSLVIPLTGNGEFLNSLVITVDGQAGSFTAERNQITVGSEQFPDPKGYHINIFTPSGIPLASLKLDVQGELYEPSIKTDKTDVLPGNSHRYEVLLPSGDHFHACVKFGQNGFNCWYIPKASAVIPVHLSCTYANTGLYANRVQTANDVSFEMGEVIVSVDVRIRTISVRASSTQSLEGGMNIAVTLNKYRVPPKFVRFDIDYGDGTAETIDYINPNKHSLVFNHNHKYSTWGRYKITVKASNAYGQVSRYDKENHGEYIQYCALFSNDERVALDSYFTVKFVVRGGTGVDYVVDLGDGTVIALPGTVFIPSSAENRTILTNTGSDTLIPFVPVSELGPTSVKYKTSDDRTRVELVSGNDIIVQHRYATDGYYTVKANATNAFNGFSAVLCPDVIVETAAVDTPPTCQPPVIRFPNVTTSPVRAMRSKDVIIEVDPGLDCKVNMSATYSLKAFRLVSLNQVTAPRPYNRVCFLKETNNTLMVPGLTLLYGLYNMSVTVSPEGLDLVYSSASFLMEVVRTPPIASLGQPSKIAYISGDMVLDLSGCRDPDISPEYNVYRFLKFKLFCCILDQQDKIKDKTQEDLVNESELIIQGKIYENGSRNEVALYDSCGCFSDTINPIFEHSSVSFPSSQFSPNSVDFLFKLFVCKSGECSSTVQDVHVRSSNDSMEYDKLGDLLTSGDTDGALQLIGLLSSDLNSLNDGVDGNEALVKEATDKRSFLINALSTVSANLTNINQVENTANALESVTRTKSQVTQNSRKSASSTMNNVARAVGASGKNQTIDKVSTVGVGILGSLSNLLPDDQDEDKFSELRRRRRRRRSLDDLGPDATDEEIKCDIIRDFIGYDNPAGCDKAYIALLDYFYPDNMDAFLKKTENDPDDIKDFIIPELSEKKSVQDKLKLEADREVAHAGMAAVDNMASLFLDKIDDNGTVSLSSSKIQVNVQKIKANTTGNTTIGSGSGAYNIPMSVLTTNAGSNASVGTKVVNSAVNQFTFGKGAADITGGVTSLTLTDETGMDLVVRDTEEPFEIWLPADPNSVAELSYHTITLGQENSEINYHAVTLPANDTSLHVEVRTTDPFDQYDVFISYMDFPNDTHHDYSDVIPRDASSVIPDLVKPCEDEDLLIHTIYPPSHLTRSNGTYRVGIKLKEAKIEVGTGQLNRTYGIRIFVSGCRFWNESTEAWETTGCEVGQCTNYNATQCLCNHLTSFGGNFVVPPNTIDFNTVWSKFANLHENAAVFATVISILILYILMLIWARYMDKKDVQKWGAVPLEDNLPSDTYHYQLAVHTGMKKGAGTDSRVSFILSGDDNDTGVRCLFDGKRKHLGRGTILNYVLSVESCLGPLTFLRIWHDNSGKGKQKSWYLDQVELIDLQTGERYYFLCGRWLAVEEEDGQVERILPVAGINDLVAFKHLFSSNVRKKLSNEHLWFSVFSRPTRSKFTRCQRISCCLSLLFLTMITNAMWFKTEETAGPVTALKVGPFSFTLHQVFISFASTMIVFPVSFLLITIFRKSRCKKNTVVQKNQRTSKKSQKYRWKTVNNPPNTWGDVEKSKKDKFKDSMRNIISFHNRRYETEAVAAAIEEEEMRKTGRKKKKKPLTLPHWCIYIAWFLVFLSVTTSAFFTILYSMEWGADKANDWLITFVMSFFQSVIVVQPVKVFLMVAFVACILKKPEINEEEGLEDDINPADDEEVLAKTPENITAIMLQRKMAAEELQPPDFQALEAARVLRLKEMKMEVIIKEIIIYAFFVLVLFFISYQTRDSQSYMYANHLRNTFLTSTNGMAFDKISTPGDYWVWVETVMLPQLYAQEWLNGTSLKWWDKRCIGDLESRRVGIGRLRQLRIKSGSCDVPQSMAPLFSDCRSAYDWTDDDTKTYLPRWQKILEENDTEVKSIMKKTPWDYQNSFELKNAPYYGNIAAYKGGGYVANFARTKSRTVDTIQKLLTESWLDVRTRAVFLEFTLYNPNVNLFSSIILLTEFMDTGGASKKIEIKVFRLFNYVGAFGTVVLLFEIIYACFTLYFLVHALKKLKKEKMKYFQSFWNKLEFALLAFSVACIVMYVFKHVLTSLAIDDLHESGSSDFVNFQSLALYDELFGYMVGCVVFLATIQFLKMLQFNRRMNMLGDTIRIATKDLKNFSVMFLIYFMAFCQLAYLLFGSTMATYDNFVSSVESMFAFCLGSFDFEAMQASQRVLGPIFFFLFVGIVYIGLMGIFVTIIYDSFASVKADVTLQTNEHEIVDFMWKRLKGLIKG